MMNFVFVAFLSVIGAASADVNNTAEAIFGIRFGDKFGDGWDGASLTFLMHEYNTSYTVSDADYRGLSPEQMASPGPGDKGFEGGLECSDPGDVIYFALVKGDNNTLLSNQEAPIQYWEIYWQVEVNHTIYHGGWNTRMAFTCDGNYTLLDWSENLLEPLTSCPECKHPKPKPKPNKPSKSKSSDDHDDHDHVDRRLGGDDDDKKKKKGKSKPPLKYWPVPVKLFDATDKDGWFIPDNFGYAEFTISDVSRLNLVAEGTLCASKGTDGYTTVCETMLPDGRYVFRGSGNLDEYSGNYTWQLCGLKTFVDGEDMVQGHMGSEVTFQVKKGECIVNKNELVTIEDYVNGSTLDAVVTLEGHFLLGDVHFSDLSAVESGILEADLNEFVSLNVEKTVSITSVQDGTDGTLVAYTVVASHAEDKLMQGLMESDVESAGANLQTQMSAGSFLNFLKSGLQTAGLADDKLMTVSSVQFVDLKFDHSVTLHNGKTASGDIVAGGDHSSIYTPIVSMEKTTAKSTSNGLVIDLVAASGVFCIIALVVVAVVYTLKPPASESEATEMDNSTANLVAPAAVTIESSASLDVSSTDLLVNRAQDATFSYQDSLSAALTQRWELNSEDTVRL